MIRFILRVVTRTDVKYELLSLVLMIFFWIDRYIVVRSISDRNRDTYVGACVLREFKRDDCEIFILLFSRRL